MTPENSNSDAELKDACRVLTRSNSTNLTKIFIDALWQAVSSSNPSLLRNLVEFSHDVLTTAEGGKLLWHAVDKGDLETATILVRAGADLTARKHGCYMGTSFLHCLAEQKNSRGYLQLARLMIDRGADVNACDSGGFSVLYYAVHFEAMDLTKELLRRGAVIDVYIEEPSTCALLLALEKYNVEYLLELMVYSVEDEATRNQRAMFVTEFYIDDNADLKFIRNMLDRGLPVDYVNPYGWTLLERAVSWGRIDLIELLLDYGADVNKETKLGYRPLFLAVCLPHTHVTVLLIKRGAKIHARSRDGDYAIHRSCESQSAKNVQLLLQLGADVDVTNERGETPFSLMDSESLTAAEFIVVRHLAILCSRGEKFHESDAELIRLRAETERFYEVCLRELEKMKNSEICDGISYFCLVGGSSKKLFIYVKNEEFVKNFKNKLELAEDSFPLYFEQMKLKFEVAEKREKLTVSTRAYVAELFSNALPCLVTDKIAFYLCFDESENVEKNHYLQLHDIV